MLDEPELKDIRPYEGEVMLCKCENGHEEWIPTFYEEPPYNGHCQDCHHLTDWTPVEDEDGKRTTLNI